MTEDPTPAEALASIRAARGSVGDRLTVHWSYDVAYGLICGGIVASLGVPAPYGSLIVVVCMLGLVLMIQWYRKQTGVWVSGLSPRRARWVALGLGFVLVSLCIASLLLTRRLGLWWAPFATGAAAGLIAVVASRLWMRVYRRELENES
ncbi:hypothetical protein [Brevundimonas sp.]|uniref:hypothetical protein n=1 Tax=Brevundimonas sp. TaxID=1871086 RepID=UPI002D235CBB|nr:hypothetical protein [Brevundimonas sp.]HYC75860.1 hypothetical protein [Brevundimonas sp.]